MQVKCHISPVDDLYLPKSTLGVTMKTDYYTLSKTFILVLITTSSYRVTLVFIFSLNLYHRHDSLV